MHLCVEAVGVKRGGGAAVLCKLLETAVADARVGRISLFCSPRSTRDFDLPVSPKITPIEKWLPEKSRLYRVWWLRKGLPPEVESMGADVLFCFVGAGAGPPSLPKVVFVQQAVPFTPEAFSRCGKGRRLRMRVIRWMTQSTCRTSRSVIVQTESLRAVLARSVGIPAERIAVVPPDVTIFPNGSGRSPRVRAMRATPAGFRLLYVGSPSPYKNVKVLIEAMGPIRSRFPDTTLFLTWPSTNPRREVPGVVRLGYLRPDALREAYEEATLLLMPSLAESAGLPMLEGMALGIPILAADRPYAHDVCGDAAVFFDPLDPTDLADKALALLGEAPRRAELARKGKARMADIRRLQPYQRMVDLLVSAAGTV